MSAPGDEARHDLRVLADALAHDLRGPLRAIEGFTSLAEAEPGLPETSRALLARSRDATARLTAHVEALVRHARVCAAELNVGDVDVSALAEELGRERRVPIHVAPGLRARADLPLLRVALDALLDNAARFARTGVDVGADADGLTVSDDGPGFPPGEAARLFEPGVRLDPGPRIGMGLATVARVASRHGGRAWATLPPEGGACFHVRLNP